MSNAVRTLRLKLNPIDATKALFAETIERFTQSFNRVAQLGWDGRISNGVELHHATYYSERELTKLPSQLAISARMKATEALKSAKELTKLAERENKKIALENVKRESQGRRPRKLKRTPGCPHSKSQAVRFDARSYTINLAQGWASLLTLEGRQRVTFTLPRYWTDVLEWTTTSADLLIDRQGVFWLHIVLEKRVVEVAPTGVVVGIDLGQVNPATDSNGVFYGDPHWASVEHRRKSHARKLQSKGTRSARRRLKKLSGTRRRFRSDCDHVLSKRILEPLNPGDTVVFEDLENIRGNARASKESRERLHSWSFDRLQFYVAYKALTRGVLVDFVDPRYTSQKCSECLHKERGNRTSQAQFTCLSCGYSQDADVNAARNIRDDFVRGSGQARVLSRAVVNQPIVGTGADSLPLTDKPATLVVGN